MNASRRFRFVFALLFANFVFLAACESSTAIQGEVASVNGRGIFFQDLEARRAVLFSGSSPEAMTFDDASMQSQYRYVLRQAIEEELIRQHMEKNGYALDPAMCEAEERRIRADYPEGAFEETLVEEGLSLERWREGIARRLLVEQFLEQVIRPEISIAPGEAEQYYREHSDEFVIPEQWHFMHVAGADAAEVAKAGRALAEGKDAEAVQKEFLVTINNVRMGKDLLPESIAGILGPLQLRKASRVQSTAGEHSVFVLLEKTPAAMVDAAEISRRVERALVEDKMRDFYAAWMEKSLSRAKIAVAPGLLESLPPDKTPGSRSVAPPPLRRDAILPEVGLDGPEAQGGVQPPAATGNAPAN